MAGSGGRFENARLVGDRLGKVRDRVIIHLTLAPVRLHGVVFRAAQINATSLLVLLELVNPKSIVERVNQEKY